MTERDDITPDEAWARATSDERRAANDELRSIMRKVDENVSTDEVLIESDIYLPPEQLLIDIKGYAERYFLLIDHIDHVLDDVNTQNLTSAERSTYKPLTQAVQEADKIRFAFRGATAELNKSEETKSILNKVIETKITE